MHKKTNKSNQNKIYTFLEVKSTPENQVRSLVEKFMELFKTRITSKIKSKKVYCAININPNKPKFVS